MEYRVSSILGISYVMISIIFTIALSIWTILKKVRYYEWNGGTKEVGAGLRRTNTITGVLFLHFHWIERAGLAAALVLESKVSDWALILILIGITFFSLIVRCSGFCLSYQRVIDWVISLSANVIPVTVFGYSLYLKEDKTNVGDNHAMVATGIVTAAMVLVIILGISKMIIFERFCPYKTSTRKEKNKEKVKVKVKWVDSLKKKKPIKRGSSISERKTKIVPQEENMTA